MKKFFYTLATIVILGNAANAQNVLFQNCEFTAPEVRNNMSIETQDVIGGAVWSTPPRLLSYDEDETPFPTIEFLITKGNNAGQTSAGDFTIIGSSIDGIFYPSQLNRYNHTVAAGDFIRAVAIGYKIEQIRNLIDTLNNNSCCAAMEDLRADFCNALSQAGINSGADINNMSQVLDILDLFASAPLTINSLLSTIATLNNSATLLNGCGASLMPICVGIDPTNYHFYEISAANNISIAVQELNALTNFSIFPNPTTSNGIVNISVETAQATDLQVNIFNTLGQRIHSQNLGKIQGQYTATIPSNNLAAGVYNVQITDGTNSKNAPLIVR